MALEKWSCEVDAGNMDCIHIDEEGLQYDKFRNWVFQCDVFIFVVEELSLLWFDCLYFMLSNFDFVDVFFDSQDWFWVRCVSYFWFTACAGQIWKRIFILTWPDVRWLVRVCWTGLMFSRVDDADGHDFSSLGVRRGTRSFAPDLGLLTPVMGHHRGIL